MGEEMVDGDPVEWLDGMLFQANGGDLMYVPESSVEWHVRQIVIKLLSGDLQYDAHHIVNVVMKTIPDHKLGSITNRSVAAAAIWNVSRSCSLRREDGIPAWTQHDVAKAAGVSGITVRNVSKRLREEI